jgi:type IV secretion system protein VirB6
VLDSIYNTLTGQMENIWTGFGTVSGLVSGPLQTAMAINLMICGFAIMRGIVNEPWGAYLSTWLRAELAILAATSSFGPWLGSVAWGLPDLLAAAIGGGGAGGGFDAFVDTVSAAAWISAEAAPKWSVDMKVAAFELPDLLAYFLASIVIACAFISAAIAMVMTLFTKFSLAVTIAVGPIFAAGLIFNSSSSMFFSWLGAALSAAVNAAAVSAALVFVSNTVWSFAASAQATGGENLAIYLVLITQAVIAIVGGVLVMQASSISGFAGSGGASGSSLVSAVMPSQRTMGRLAGAIGKSSGKSISKAATGTSRAINSARPSTWQLQGASTRGK